MRWWWSLIAVESGSFLEPLRYVGPPGRRTVMTACGAGEPTHLWRGAWSAFRKASFNGLLMGLDLRIRFYWPGMRSGPYQGCLVDAEWGWGGVWGERGSGGGWRGFILGRRFGGEGMCAGRMEVLGNQSLSGTSQATLSGLPTSPRSIRLTGSGAWVRPPGHDPNPANPVRDLPSSSWATMLSPGPIRSHLRRVYGNGGLQHLLLRARQLGQRVCTPTGVA